ncbi:MAG: GNAT family N-acetyltransferase [Polyangiaceae bacterium]
MSDAEPRLPPQRIRTTKLQEAQLAELVEFERAAMQMYRAEGYTEEHVEARDDRAIARLTKNHDVIVAEADHLTAGYMAWADQAPGVAVLTQMCIGPEFQRFGIATRLLRELGDTASGHGIEYVACIVWPSAAWALSFLATRGFMPVDQGVVPEHVAKWCKTAASEVLQDGQIILWRETEHLGHTPGLPKPSN